jgi:hypothetical protein
MGTRRSMGMRLGEESSETRIYRMERMLRIGTVTLILHILSILLILVKGIALPTM